MKTLNAPNELYRAHLTPDTRFGGQFFVVIKNILRDSNVFLTDLEIQKRLKQFNFKPERWSSWCAYSAMLYTEH